VVSSLFGACFSPILIFRRPSTPHTRVATHRMLSAIRPPELSHGTAESCRIVETMTAPNARIRPPEYQEHEDPTALRLNRLLEAPRARENYDHLDLPRTAKMRKFDKWFYEHMVGLC